MSNTIKHIEPFSITLSDFGVKVLSAEVRTDMSEKAYRAAEGLSQSELNTFIASPNSLKTERLFPKKPTDEMEFGTALHSHILDLNPESVCIEQPDFGHQGSKENKAKKQEWEAAHQGLIYLDAGDAEKGKLSDLKKIDGMILSLENNPANSWLMSKIERDKGKSIISSFKSNRELKLFADIEINGRKLRLKGMLDFYDAETASINDFKTCTDASEQKFRYTVTDRGYDIQAVQYTFLALACGLDVQRYYMHPIEKRPKEDKTGCNRYETACYAFTKHTEVKAKWIDALSRYAECEEKDIWPSYNNNEIKAL